jgi:hypothetical protein
MPVEPDPELFQDGPGKIPLVVTGSDPDTMEQAAEAGVAPWADIYLPPDDLPEEQAAALLEAVAAEDQGEGEGEGEEEEVDPATEAGGKYPRPPERGVELSQLLVAVEEPALAMEHRGERGRGWEAAQQRPWQCARKQGAVSRQTVMPCDSSRLQQTGSPCWAGLKQVQNPCCWECTRPCLSHISSPHSPLPSSTPSYHHPTPPDSDVMVFGVTDDPDDVIPGDIFCCLSRVNHLEGVWDGHDHVAQAVEMGAAAILAQEGADMDLDDVPDHVPVVWVPSVQEMAQRLAAVLHGEAGRPPGLGG